jgi:CubicO group peptidase (beta-lactamase class C family)
MAALADLPLLYQPGDRFHYSHATEVLGFLVGRIGGGAFRDVLMDRLLKPLGMADTDFWVPPAKRDRLATVYRFSDKAGVLRPTPMPTPDAPPAYAAGGGGLISTADDYLRFARMLLADGELEGVRILKPETVRLMRTNRLTQAQREIPFMGLPMWAGMGFGLGLSIIDHPERNMMGTGSVGTFSWPGAFGTWWQADPVKDKIQLFMIQHSMPLTPDLGAQLAGGRAMAGRAALPAYQQLTDGELAAPAG